MVSIIIPVYNTAQYLRQCLRSVVNQTLGNIEIIVVNDASTDGSQQIIDEYAEKDPRIVALRHTHNSMLGATRNTALAVRRGTYVMFLDSDDYLDVAACETLCKEMERTNADFIEFNFKEVAENPDVSLGDYSIAKEEWLHDPLAAFLEFRLLSSVCNKIFKTEVWKKVCFREQMLHEDDVAMFELLQHCTGAMKIPLKFYSYRRHPGSITRKPLTEQHVLSMGRVLEEIHHDARSHAFYEPYMQRVTTMLMAYCAVFLRRVQESSTDDKTKRTFYGMIAEKFMGLSAEYSTMMIDHVFDVQQECAMAEQRHTVADRKLRKRKKIILALFAYACIISVGFTALAWIFVN